MNGKGTEKEPFEIASVYDFCEVSDVEGQETTYYKLVENIDFNDHEKWRAGFDEVLVVNAPNSVIDGNGKRIRNILFRTITQADGVIRLRKITNAYIENIVLNNTETYSRITYGFFDCDHESCSFSVDIMNSQFCALQTQCRNNSGSEPVTHVYLNCTFNVYGNTSSRGEGVNFSRMIMKRCHINFSNLISNGSGYNNQGVTLLFTAEEADFDTVYFTGSITQKHFRRVPDAGQTIGLSYRGTFSNCYCAVRVIRDENIVISALGNDGQFYPTFKSLCFIDRSLIEVSASFSDGTYLKFLTTAQAKDTEYLRNIGFPVKEVGT